MAFQYHKCKYCKMIICDDGATFIDINLLGSAWYCNNCFEFLLCQRALWPEASLVEKIVLKSAKNLTKEKFTNFVDLEQSLKGDPPDDITIHWANGKITKTTAKDLSCAVRDETKASMYKLFTPSLGYLQDKIEEKDGKIERVQERKRKIEEILKEAQNLYYPQVNKIF